LRRQIALSDSKRLAAEAKLAVPEGGKGARYLAAVGAALMDLDLAKVVLPAKPGEASATLGVQVTGIPVLNRGLSHSVDENQRRSFFMAMGLVFVIVLVLYRSFWSALLAMTPVCLTLLVIYGGMGLIGVHLDIGTSMLASLTTGAGVDYAVHLLAAWKGPPGEGRASALDLRKAPPYSSLLLGRALRTHPLTGARALLGLP